MRNETSKFRTPRLPVEDTATEVCPQVHRHALPPSQMAAMSRELTGLKAARMAELEHDMRLAQGWYMY